MPPGTVGTGSTHHLAFAVESAEELEAWRDYLRAHGVESTDVFDRGSFRSIYLRDPDGHIVEIATRGPGFAGARRAGPPFRSCGPLERRLHARLERGASASHWRSVIVPMCLFSGMCRSARQRRLRSAPQRRWLVSSSPTGMLVASQGVATITSAARSWPAATRRLSSARAKRTRFARSKASRRCGMASRPGAIVAVPVI